MSQVTLAATIEQTKQLSPSVLSGIGTNLFERQPRPFAAISCIEFWPYPIAALWLQSGLNHRPFNNEPPFTRQGVFS